MKYVRLASWNSYESVGFNTPKGHAVLHFLPFVFLFGAVDNARLEQFRTWPPDLGQKCSSANSNAVCFNDGATWRCCRPRRCRSRHAISGAFSIYWFLYQFMMVLIPKTSSKQWPLRLLLSFGPLTPMQTSDLWMHLPVCDLRKGDICYTYHNTRKEHTSLVHFGIYSIVLLSESSK